MIRCLTRPLMRRTPLLKNLRHWFSEDSDIFMDQGSLQVRNSDFFELKLFKLHTQQMKVEPVSVVIPSSATLSQLAQTIQ